MRTHTLLCTHRLPCTHTLLCTHTVCMSSDTHTCTLAHKHTLTIQIRVFTCLWTRPPLTGIENNCTEKKMDPWPRLCLSPASSVCNFVLLLISCSGQQ